MNKRGQVLIGIILIAIAATATFLITYNVKQSITGQAITKTEECEKIYISYEEQEKYNEQEPYQEKECEETEIIYTKIPESCTQDYSCEVNNLDTKGGNFIIRIGFETEEGKVETIQTEYIGEQQYY